MVDGILLLLIHTGHSKFANGNRYDGEWANGVIHGTLCM